MRTLIVMRHGKAAPDSPTGLDADRPLTKRGRRQSAYVASWITEHLPAPVRIAASFLTRANQTAAIVAEGLVDADIDAVVTREPSLEFGHDRATTDALADVISTLLEVHPAATAMLVGHNPQLEQLVSVLSMHADHANASLRTGMACVFEVTPGEDVLSSARLLDRVRLDESE